MIAPHNGTSATPDGGRAFLTPETDRMPHARSALQHTPALDGLRGLAILCVLLSHAGVPLFGGSLIMFVLSGFLITAGLMREYDQTGRIAIRAFYTRRALRLLPALVAMLLAVNALTLAIHPALAPTLITDTQHALTLMSNWAQIGHSTHAPLLSHLWSLAVQEQFYILWPVVVQALMRRTRAGLLVACLLLAAVTCAIRLTLVAADAPLSLLYFATYTRIDGVFLGAALAVVLSMPAYGQMIKWSQTRPHLVTVASVSVVLILAVCLMCYPMRDRMTYVVSLPLVSLCATLLIALCVMPQTSALKRLLEHRALVHLGLISYGVYLWHYPAVQLLHLAGVWYARPLGVLIGVALGQLSYVLIERPLLRRRSNTEPPCCVAIDDARTVVL